MRDTGATISVEPWRSETTLMKFATYVLAAWLCRCFARQSHRANFLLNALIAFGGAYAAYALVMAALGFSQYALFYGASPNHAVAGPFFNRDHYATYAGIVTLCAGVRFVERGNAVVILGRGFRQFLLTLLQYVFGNGAPYLISLALAFSSLVATGSRAGNFATFIAIACLLVLVGVLAMRQRRVLATSGLIVAVIAGGGVLFFINDAFLVARLQDLASSGLQLGLRLQLWNSALLMIQAAPLLGLGLGTYQLIYPMYSDAMTAPFLTVAAHNDYFELAAGWGLPAALCWWLALLWLTFICVWGVFVRRRNRAYPMIAVGVGVLVGIHAYFDFSLQMPATALTFATILGLGVAQAFPTRTASQ